jgi:hypothetical protein
LKWQLHLSFQRRHSFRIKNCLCDVLVTKHDGADKAYQFES